MKKQIQPNELVIDYNVQRLCFRPYPNHPHGCPNYGKKAGCPPTCPKIEDMVDVTKPMWVIWNVFDFGSHCRKMKIKHPTWTKRQIECCLYWQQTARKKLKEIISDFIQNHAGMQIMSAPEANGVNLTHTMYNIGEALEWPPKTKTYQIAIAGKRGFTANNTVKKIAITANSADIVFDFGANGVLTES